MTLLIHEAALLMSIQDGGRLGYQRFGLPESGPMDHCAFWAANRLVGNDLNAACVEIGFSSVEFQLECRSLLAVCGAGYRLTVNKREMPLWMAFLGKSGDRIRMAKTPGGNWAYLAVGGGIRSALWMGSRSTYPAAGLGQMLVKGDRLPLSLDAGKAGWMAGLSIPVAARPTYSANPRIRVIPGPHQDRFPSASWATFWGGNYSISAQSNRMGYRLVGPTLAHQGGADLVSQGMVLGEIQVPGDGQPIVMMPDHPTTGGYTCIGTVARADLPLLAQVEPGQAACRFVPVDVREAQLAWAEVVAQLDSFEHLQEDAWLGL